LKLSASFFADISFEGIGGASILQQKVILPGPVEIEVNGENDADAYDGLGNPAYDKTRDSYFLNPFASGDVMVLQQDDNFYRIAAGTGVGSTFEDAELAYVAATGPVEFYGSISRQGVTYPVDGLALI